MAVPQIQERASAGELLLYFDNFEDVLKDDSIIKWLRSVSGIKGVSYLISSRETLVGIAKNITVKKLEPDAAETLFLQEWNKSDNSVKLTSSLELKEFLEEIDRHPLSIVLTAAQGYRYTSLREIREAWKKSRVDLACLPLGESDRVSSLEVSIAHSYKAIQHYPEAKRIWGMMIFFPYGMRRENLCAIFKTESEKVKKAVERLLRLNLLEQQPEYLTMLSPLRGFIFNFILSKDEQGSKEDCGELAFEFFYHLAENAAENLFGDMHVQTLHPLLDELRHIIHYTEWTLDEGDRWKSYLYDLHLRLINFYQFQSLISCTMLGQYLVVYGVQMGNTERASAHKSLGDLKSRLGQVDEAARHYEEAMELYRAERANLGLANTLQSLGDMRKDAGQMEDAQAFYQNAINLYNDESDVVGLAYTYAELFEVYCYTGQEERLEDTIKNALHFAQASNTPPVIGYVVEKIKRFIEVTGSDEGNGDGSSKK